MPGSSGENCTPALNLSLLAHSATNMGTSITATGKAIECCHPFACTSLTGSESDPLKAPCLAGEPSTSAPSAFQGKQGRVERGPAEAGWKAGWMHRAGKEQATRGGRAAGPEGSKVGLGSLVLQRNLRGGWQHHALQPSWNHPHPLDIPGTAPCYWSPACDVSPQSPLEQSESHCGATCLHPPREC